MPLPRFQPLAVGRRPAPFNNRDYFFEIKWDGFRCLARVEHGRCKLVSRNDNEFKSFSSLNAAIAQELKNRSVVLDGEIVCLDNAGKPQFYDLLFKRGEPRLCAWSKQSVGLTLGGAVGAQFDVAPDGKRIAVATYDRASWERTTNMPRIRLLS